MTTPTPQSAEAHAPTSYTDAIMRQIKDGDLIAGVFPSELARKLERERDLARHNALTLAREAVNREEEIAALVGALEATAHKLQSISAAARGMNGHSEHTLNVLAKARAALSLAKGATTP